MSHEPAAIVALPVGPRDVETDETRRIDAEREADVHMAALHSEIEMLVLKADALAKLHGRQMQAVCMFDNALAQLRLSLCTVR